MGLGVNQNASGNPHHPFSWGAASGGRQLAGMLRNVGTDHGEIAVGKFPNVRAAVGVTAGSASRVVLRTDSSDEHGRYVTSVTYAVKRGIW